MPEKVRAHIFVSGFVQGVFFRAETRGKAQELNINGWVRNTKDGKVEAVFEGERDGVEKIIEWAKRGPPPAVVKKVDVVWEEYKDDFKNFELRL